DPVLPGDPLRAPWARSAGRAVRGAEGPLLDRRARRGRPAHAQLPRDRTVRLRRRLPWRHDWHLAGCQRPRAGHLPCRAVRRPHPHAERAGLARPGHARPHPGHAAADGHGGPALVHAGVPGPRAGAGRDRRRHAQRHEPRRLRRVRRGYRGPRPAPAARERQGAHACPVRRRRRRRAAVGRRLHGAEHPGRAPDGHPGHLALRALREAWAGHERAPEPLPGGAVLAQSVALTGLPAPIETSQMTGRPAVAGAGRTPCARRIAATRRAIHASPAAVGCRLSAARGNDHWPASGSMMTTPGSAAVPAEMIARSIPRSAGVPPKTPAKVVSSPIRAPGAAAWIRSTVARTRRSSSAAEAPRSSCPAWTMTSAGSSAGRLSAPSILVIGPRPKPLALR